MGIEALRLRPYSALLCFNNSENFTQIKMFDLRSSYSQDSQTK